MISALFEKLLMVLLGIGYVPFYLSYGSKAMDARKKLGKDKLDLALALLLTGVIVFWAVRLVILLRSYAPKQWETAFVYGLPGLYVLWFMIARINAKRFIRAAQKMEQDTKAAADTSGSVKIPTDDGGEMTIAFKQVGSASSQSDADALAKLLGVNDGEKNESGEPDVPLTENFCLGGHHVSGSNMHISMTVSYEAATHSVIYAHSSSEDPEVREVFPVPEDIRTVNALKQYIERATSIPSVWRY